MSKIEFKDVALEYESKGKKKRVLDNINLNIDENEFVCLIGPSGCGKSTLLSLVSGLNKPTKGNVLLNGEKIKGAGTDRGVVFQHYSLFPWMTAKKNVMFGIKQAKKEKEHKKIEERADYFLEKVELADSSDKYPYELSGGMQQRVALARTLAMDTDILLMDEPFGAIDPKVRYELQELTLDLCKKGEKKKTAIFVTHDIDEAIVLADRIIFMKPGKIQKDIKVSDEILEVKNRAELYTSNEYKKLHDNLVNMFYQDVAENIGGNEVVL